MPDLPRREDALPTYQYACTSCGEELEVVQKFTDDPLTECPQCQGRLRKVFSAVGVVFKGSGFYKTDSRSSSRSSTSSAGAKEPAKESKESATSGSSSKDSGSTSGSSDSTKSSASSSGDSGSSTKVA